MRLRFFIFGILLLCLSWTTMAQEGFLPKGLNQNINSTYDDFNPVVSPDGKTLYFVRSNHPENHYGEHDSQDIWFSTFKSGQWTEAIRMPEPFNRARYNAVVGISGDGQFLYVNGIFSKKTGKWKKRGISVAQMTDGGWGNPVPLKIYRFSRVNRGYNSNACISSDGSTLVFSFTKKFHGKRNNLYYSIKKGNHYLKPKPFPKQISSRKYREEAPSLSRTGDTLYFSRNKSKNKDDFDVYFAVRHDLTWDHWSVPYKLTDTVNSDAWDSYYKTNAKGSYAYFSTNRKTAVGGIDIYKVKLFEENPYAWIRGVVANQTTTEPFKQAPFQVLINGKAYDSVRINVDSATYRVKLRLGSVYKIEAKAPYYTSVEETIDLTKEKEFCYKNQNLFLRPLPYVLIKGKILVKGSKDSLPSASEPQIWVNGSPFDSAKISFPGPNYQMLIPYGSKIKIMAVAHSFVQIQDSIDLRGIKGYKEIKKDLYVKNLPFVLLSGRFLNKTTGALIPNSAHPTLLVNGLTVDSAQIDTANGTFKLALPYGQQYTLEVKATKYISIPSTLNLLGVQSYAIIQQDVYATEDEKHFGLLKGIVINKKTGKPMSSNVPYEIHVNQMQSLAAKINPENGSYSIELPLGALHTVNAKAPGFYPVFEQIDLSKQKTNTVVMKDLVLAPIEVGQSIRLNNIFFEFGKATLKKESFPELNRVVKFLNDNPSIRIEIAGHTDNIGKVEKNKTISQYRAKAVAHYIEKQGIEDKRVDFKGYGATKPVANNKTAVGRALNRRVEFTIISK